VTLQLGALTTRVDASDEVEEILAKVKSKSALIRPIPLLYFARMTN